MAERSSRSAVNEKAAVAEEVQRFTVKDLPAAEARPSSFALTTLLRRSEAKKKTKSGKNLPFVIPESFRVDLYEAFELFDTKSAGYISLDDVRVAIRALGFEPTRDQLKSYGELVNYDRTKRVSFNDFITIMSHKMTEKDSKEDLVKAFRLMDSDNTGRVDYKKLTRVNENLSLGLSKEELKEMIDFAKGESGRDISLQEYLRFVQDTSLNSFRI